MKVADALTQRIPRPLRWSTIAIAAFGAVIAIVAAMHYRHSPLDPVASAADSAPESPAAPDTAGQVRVQTVKPTRGGIERTTSQPGSLYSFESAALFAKVSGYLKSQPVDIGDRVKRGDVLAEIDAPELDIAVQQAEADVVQAKSEVDQMKAHLVTAQAKWQAAIAGVTQSEAELGRATAQRAFQEKQYQRIKKLFELNSIDERLVDEKQDEMEAARASERAAEAAIVTAKADVASAAAKVEEAKADISAYQAKVLVSQAALDKAKTFADYKKIISPYDGVVTQRTFSRGAFIRAAVTSGESPLLVVDRTDLMRVVFQVPDLDVPWIDRGNSATVEIDALPGEPFSGVVSRMADSEDAQSRTMRVEIDLPNPSGRLRQGMYGRVTIKLRAGASALVVPGSSLVGPLKDGKGTMYVVRDGKACLVPVKVSADDGAKLEVRQGLAATDDVVYQHNGAIADGVPVAVINDGEK